MATKIPKYKLKSFQRGKVTFSVLLMFRKIKVHFAQDQKTYSDQIFNVALSL